MTDSDVQPEVGQREAGNNADHHSTTSAFAILSPVMEQRGHNNNDAPYDGAPLTEMRHATAGSSAGRENYFGADAALSGRLLPPPTTPPAYSILVKSSPPLNVARGDEDVSPSTRFTWDQVSMDARWNRELLAGGGRNVTQSRSFHAVRFLVARSTTHFYKRVCPTVRPSVRQCHVCKKIVEMRFKVIRILQEP